MLAGAGYAAYQHPNEQRVGLRLLGLLHPAADGLKTVFKEDFIPPERRPAAAQPGAVHLVLPGAGRARRHPVRATRSASAPTPTGSIDI